MNFSKAILLRLFKKKIYILRNKKDNKSNTVWSNKEYTNIVVAFVNDGASTMIKKKCVHYTQLDKDVADSPIKSVTPKVRVNEVTQQFNEDHKQDG